MASESGDSNMDREMILADFQVCLFCMFPFVYSVVNNLSAIVELPWAAVNNSSHDVVNNRAELSFAFCG